MEGQNGWKCSSDVGWGIGETLGHGVVTRSGAESRRTSWQISLGNKVRNGCDGVVRGMEEVVSVKKQGSKGLTQCKQRLSSGGVTPRRKSASVLQWKKERRLIFSSRDSNSGASKRASEGGWSGCCCSDGWMTHAQSTFSRGMAKDEMRALVKVSLICVSQMCHEGMVHL